MDGRNNGAQANDDDPRDSTAVRSTVPLAIPSAAQPEPEGPAASAEPAGPADLAAGQRLSPGNPVSSPVSSMAPQSGAVDLGSTGTGHPPEGLAPSPAVEPAGVRGSNPSGGGSGPEHADAVAGAAASSLPPPPPPPPVEPGGPGMPVQPEAVPPGAAPHMAPGGQSSLAGQVQERFRGLVNRRRDASAERAAWTQVSRVPLTRPIRVVVASAGGGLGKTTVSLLLGEALAGLRADGVAVLDAQPLGGTVGARVQAQPGWGLNGLIGGLDDVLADGSYSAWSKWATVEHTTRLTVFGRQRPFEGDELKIHDYARLSGGLSRLWPILVVDTGAPEGRSALQLAVIQLADVLVVVGAPGSATVAATAGWLQDISIPRERRVGAIVPLTGGDPDEVNRFMHAVCGQVAHIPVDKALAAEAAVPMLGNARGRTQDAVTRLAGMVMRAATHPTAPAGGQAH